MLFFNFRMPDSEEEAIERALRIYDSNTFDYVELEDEEREEDGK